MRMFLHNSGPLMGTSVMSSIGSLLFTLSQLYYFGGVEPQGVYWSLSLAPGHVMFVYILYSICTLFTG